VLTHLAPEEEALRLATIEASRRVEDVTLVEIFTEQAASDAPEPASAAADVEQVAPDHGHAEIFAGARGSIGVLAFLTVVGGLIFFTPLLAIEPHHIVWYLAATSVLLVVAAWIVVRRMASLNLSGDAADLLGARRIAMFDRDFGADGIYVAVVSPVVKLARVVVTADREVIDAYVRGTVVVTRWTGIASERMHTRKPSSYLVWVLLGLLAVGVSGVTLW